MKPKFCAIYASILVALLLLLPILRVAAGEILYEDKFTNLDPSWGVPGERLSVEDGKLTLKPAPDTTQSVLNQANVFDDADIRVEVILPAGDASVPGGLIFWAKDHSNFYCLCIDAAGYFKISRYVTDRWLQPVGWIENQAINKGIGQVNKLRVVTQGRQATAYINDKQVTTFNGQPPQGGGCIGVSGGSPEKDAKYLAVYQPASDGPAAGAPAEPSPLAVQPQPAAVQPPPAAQASPTPAEAQRSPSAPEQPVNRVALRLHGSNTIGKELVPALCEEFLKFEGASSVERKPRQKEDETDVDAVLPNRSSEPLTFEVQAHGTKTAFEDLAAGKCDIGMASRRITQEEARQCATAGLGDMFSPGCEIVLGADGIAVFVNKRNPISALTKQQLADIFSGRTTDWSQVGGNPGSINLYAGDENSGTFDTFKSLVLESSPLSTKASRYENSAKLSDEVAADVNGIGFTGMAFVRGSKPLAISEAEGTALLPTPFTVAAGTYPLSRRLFLYLPANPRNEWTRKFVDFALSELGGPSKLTPTRFFRSQVRGIRHDKTGSLLLVDLWRRGCGPRSAI